MVTVFRRVLFAVCVAVATVGLGFNLATVSSGEVTQLSGKKSGKKNSAFKPKKLAGTWKGSWKNETFGESGPATIKLKVAGKKKRQKMYVSISLGGSALGCPSLPTRKATLKKGKGKNRWNNSGFKIEFKNDNGTSSFNYAHRSGKISGKGVSPCVASVTYSFKGKMNNKQANAETEIFNDGEKFADSALSLKKK